MFSANFFAARAVGAKVVFSLRLVLCQIVCPRQIGVCQLSSHGKRCRGGSANLLANVSRFLSAGVSYVLATDEV